MKCLCCNEELENNELFWHKKCIKKFFDGDELPNIELNLEDIVSNNLIKGQSVTGIQPKFSFNISVNKKKTVLIGSDYIIKMNTPIYKELTETEFLCMTMARLIINVPLFGLLPYKDDYLYITKRFDRINNSKIHVEDFAQLLGFPTENKYLGSYEQCAKKVISKYCDAPLLELSNFFLRVLFAYVTLNSDMHLKNFSLLETPEIKLSPQYDLLPVKLFLNDDEDLALTLNDKKKDLKRDDFVIFGKTIGLKKPEKLIDYLISYEDKFLAIIATSRLKEDTKIKFKNMMQERFLMIK